MDLQVTKREEKINKLRRDKKIPAVVYGAGQENESVVVDLPEFEGETKEEVKGKPGEVVFRMGEVSGEDGKREDVYVKVHHDGSTVNRGTGGVEIIIEDPPEGIRRQTGTPQETLTALGGKPPKRLNVRIGMMNATIKNGKKISFNRNVERQGRKVYRNKRSLVTSRKNKRGHGKLLY